MYDSNFRHSFLLANLFAVIGFVICFPLGATAQKILYEKKLAVLDTTLVYAEPHLVVHPTNADHFIITSAVVDPTGDSIMHPVAITTTDNGNTWNVYKSPISDAIDVWACMNKNGIAYFSTLLTKGGYIYMHKSIDGGVHWNQPTPSFGRGHDHQTMVADMSAKEYDGEMYVISVRDVSDKNRDYGDVFLGRTNEKGNRLNFTNSFRFSGLSTNTFTPVIATTGEIIIPFATFAKRTPAGNTVRLNNSITWIIRSSDGGKTFSTPSYLGETGSFNFPVAAIDTAKYRDRIYFLSTRNDSGYIRLHVSDDKGDTWTEPRMIHTYKHPSTRFSGVPQIAVNNKGVVAISWAERNSSNGSCQNIYASFSFDGGVHFSAPLKVSSEQSCATEGKNGWAAKRWNGGGDYFGFAAKANGNFMLCWADSRSGKFELYTSEIACK
jgi:Neuraminidase (sialidase)